LLAYATWSQWGDLQRRDPDEWVFLALACLPCIFIVATQIVRLRCRIRRMRGGEP
jgi:hypothetical protein